MRPLDQYVTLRRGREVLRQTIDEEGILRVALLKKWYRKLTRRIGIRLVIWGYKLQRVGTLSDAPLS